MNIAKNMEFIFVAAIALAGLTSIATAAVPKFRAAPAALVQVAANDVNMNTVIVVGKRLSAAQKAAL
jgi:hypothetical protein